MSIAERLRQIRRQLGYTQQEVADKLAVTQSVIAAWETEQKAPLVESLTKYAVLGINHGWLASGEGPMFLEASEASITGEKRKFYTKNVLGELRLSEIEENQIRRRPTSDEIYADHLEGRIAKLTTELRKYISEDDLDMILNG